VAATNAKPPETFSSFLQVLAQRSLSLMAGVTRSSAVLVAADGVAGLSECQ